MLKQIGLNSAADLFSSIPEELRLQRPLNTPTALSELELLNGFERMADANLSAKRTSFVGAGAYSHYIPTVVDHIISRSEFFTAYTPYQPEVSQGTLQVIYEFQSMMGELYNMEVSNASMYDGASALAEAALMAVNVTGRRKIITPASIHPHSRGVVRTYTEP